VDYRRALHLVQPPGASWEPPVLTCSAIERTGLAELWSEIERHRALMTETGERDERRRDQKLTWMRTMLQERLLAHFDADPAFASARADAEAAVSDGSLSPSVAVDQLLDGLGS
ncbi:MAG TPA: methylmalonyl Co-A mutase-associated GTPase MeaB, partial [Acidimicrobiaceae bacterium]|nr:methylmalonyl Co-A mutase-associated GTPase MeaB [Acidimicrobiaceae bacterium]